MNILADTTPYKECTYIKHQAVTAFITRLKPPSQMQRQHTLAKAHHLLYLDEPNVPHVSKPYFLYIWFCCKKGSSATPQLSHYSYFDGETRQGYEYIVSNKTYWNFTQDYVGPATQIEDLVIHCESLLDTDIYAPYPISLKSLLDRTKLLDKNCVYTLIEGNIALVKSMPKPLERQDDDILSKVKTEQNKLIMTTNKSVVCCDHKKCNVISVRVASHELLVSMISNLLRSNNVKHNKTNHRLVFPAREFNYNQILEWLTRSNTSHSIDHSCQKITIYKLFYDADCHVTNEILDTNECYYDNKGQEIYRLKNERVLVLTVSASIDIEYIKKQVHNIYGNLDHSITEDRVDPMDLPVANIAKLRATNSVIFDSMYCRKAPPEVQPLLIKKSQVQEQVNAGKMVLVYDGRYYTTRDISESSGHNYIGMINRFGDYDPTKPYAPIIRTYKTNHLLSEGFKELKLYLLRNSSNPNKGRISRDDIILPKALQGLYDKDIENPNAVIQYIHSKKIVISNKNKILTAEVPDYIKSIIGVSALRREVAPGRGNRLLEVCDIDTKDFKDYLLANYTRYPDSAELTLASVENDFNNGTLDHRIYGRIIEEYLGKCVLVFSIDHLISYRYSMYSKDLYLPLYLTSAGEYELVVCYSNSMADLDYIVSNLNKIRDMCNDRLVNVIPPGSSYTRRNVDYTKTAIGIVCFITNAIKDLGDYRIIYNIVPEQSLQAMVEEVYDQCIFQEGIVKSSDSEYLDIFVNMRKQTAKITLTMYLILRVLSPFIYRIVAPNKDSNDSLGTVVVLSPVDMSRYYSWYVTLEDVLYPSANAYNVSIEEEVQCIALRREVGYVHTNI